MSHDASEGGGGAAADAESKLVYHFGHDEDGRKRSDSYFELDDFEFRPGPNCKLRNGNYGEITVYSAQQPGDTEQKLCVVKRALHVAGNLAKTFDLARISREHDFFHALYPDLRVFLIRTANKSACFNYRLVMPYIGQTITRDIRDRKLSSTLYAILFNLTHELRRIHSNGFVHRAP